MSITKLRRTIAVAISVAALMLTFAAPVAAHTLTVEPKGNTEAKHVWVGALNVPGQGQGLIPGGPGGIYTLTPAHALGQIVACEANEAKPSVVDIRGPGGPGCPHGE